MSDGCSGYGTLETQQCRECHAEGGTWVHHPDGSYGCTWVQQKDGGSMGTAVLLALILVGLAVGATQLDK